MFSKASFPDTSKGVILWKWVNSLPNDKTLDLTKVNAFADDKFNMARMTVSLFDEYKTLWEKEKKCWLTAFSPFPTGPRSGGSVVSVSGS